MDRASLSEIIARIIGITLLSCVALPWTIAMFRVIGGTLASRFFMVAGFTLGIVWIVCEFARELNCPHLIINTLSSLWLWDAAIAAGSIGIVIAWYEARVARDEVASVIKRAA